MSILKDCLQGPLEGKRLDGVVELLKYLTRKVVTVIELRQILDKFRARHLSTNILTMQIRVEQHYRACQCVNRI